MTLKLNDYKFPLGLQTPKVIVVYIEAENSNINGDPDKDGAPRVCEYTFRGILRSAAFKRKLRDYLLLRPDERHFVQKGNDLGKVQEPYTDPKKVVADFRDLRYFGSPLTDMKSRKIKDTQIRGPFVVKESMTVDPVEIVDMSITRVAHHEKEDLVTKEKKEGANMGNTRMVRYGLYKVIITFDVAAAQKVGLTEEDMDLFWEALFECWEHTRSANRSDVNLRRVYCFDYPHRRGGVPQHIIKDWPKAVSNGEPQSFEDYTITVNTDDMPEGMTFHAWEDGVTSFKEA